MLRNASASLIEGRLRRAMIPYLTDRKFHARIPSVDRESRHGPKQAVPPDYPDDRRPIRGAVSQRGCLRRLSGPQSLAEGHPLPPLWQPARLSAPDDEMEMGMPGLPGGRRL